MGSFSIWHWLVVLAIVLIVFGGSSKISTLMGDVAKGIKSFKKNMADDESMAEGEETSSQPTLPTSKQGEQASPYSVQQQDKTPPHSGNNQSG
ncbi:twin-arginine translocase TatA/TatE family subunit [Entomobacter blattae]|uniref:Sec-independent protein translocase protein TatA n=1 Tax=Entomobacter blattae TaxID=2762277 RepID=A0A7H1NUQ9_9PROT|nr:twin-arginine translocase TatA/TatE family subunit [Entomobacter blattae]QNT79519.1 Sec-independent protein translocase protein TatA [Entomobacter blattae]